MEEDGDLSSIYHHSQFGRENSVGINERLDGYTLHSEEILTVEIILKTEEFAQILGLDISKITVCGIATIFRHFVERSKNPSKLVCDNETVILIYY